MKANKLFLLSIIIPCYNVSNFIDDFLCCINDVSLDRIQFIFINDGSTDNTLDKINNFRDKNPDLSINIINQKNSGVCASRNIGLANSLGKYILFLDPDDLFMPNSLEYMIKTIEIERADAFCFKGKLVRENYKYEHKLLRKFNYSVYTEKDLPYIFKSGMSFKDLMFGSPFIMFKNENIKRMMSYPNIFKNILGEDSDFCINYLLKCNKIIINKNYYYYYRIRKGSLLHSKFNVRELSILKSNDRLLEKDMDSDVQMYAKSRNCLNSIAILQKMVNSKYNNKNDINYVYFLYRENLKNLHKCKLFPWYIRYFTFLTKPYFYIRLRAFLK